ncbi:299_t:CDS:2, partial [Cetraspora pellucida]
MNLSSFVVTNESSKNQRISKPYQCSLCQVKRFKNIKELYQHETLSNSAKRSRIKQIVNYSKDMTFEKIKSQACVHVMDSNYISREAFRSMAKIYPELDREYIISNKKLNLDKIMQDIIPLYIMDININSSTIFATNNEELHIDNEEIIYG